MKPIFSFTKEERICSKKELDFLFSEGLSFTAYPLRIIYVERETVSDIPVSILISVPKKRFKRAVKRNRIKRLVRESYRLNKPDLISFLSEKEKSIQIAFLYVSDKLPEYKDIEQSVLKCFNILKERLS